MLATLTVLVMLSGGPPGLQSSQPIPDGTISIYRGHSLIAASNVGNLTVQVRPGVYRITSGAEGSLRPCSGGTVRVRAHRRVTVRETCSVL
jgi:hypothetical protein